MSGCGLVIGTVLIHDLTIQSIQSARDYSESATSVIVVEQGVVTPPIDGVETVSFAGPIGQEKGLWPFAFRRALEAGWEYCAIVHDDFVLLERGWERQIRDATARWRIGIAGWCTYARFDHAPSVWAPRGRIGVFADGCGLVFCMNAFASRGSFSDLTCMAGDGDLEASLFTLSQRRAVFHLDLQSDHKVANNSRAHFHWPWDTTETIQRYASVLPAYVLDDDFIEVHGERVDMRR